MTNNRITLLVHMNHDWIDTKTRTPGHLVQKKEDRTLRNENPKGPFGKNKKLLKKKKQERKKNA
jgi:hypothetical protein